MDPQPPNWAILDLDRKVRRRNRERIERVSIVDHRHGQILIVNREDNPDRMHIGIVVPVLDAVGDEFFDRKKNQVPGLGSGLVRQKPAVCLLAGMRNRGAVTRHFDSQAFTHNAMLSGRDGRDYKLRLHRHWMAWSVCSMAVAPSLDRIEPMRVFSFGSKKFLATRRNLIYRPPQSSPPTLHTTCHRMLYKWLQS